jgi:hypothetical protein
MLITIKDKFNTQTLRDTIQDYINVKSRFTAEVEIKGKTVIKIRNIRLRESRKYCGNHPNACELNTPGRKTKYLEGADWVEFNDMINDICDSIGLNARVRTSVCEVRRGTDRRIRYNSHMEFIQWQWDKIGDDEDYENYIGLNAPDSEYPFGTPGVYQRNNKNEPAEAIKSYFRNIGKTPVYSTDG